MVLPEAITNEIPVRIEFQPNDFFCGPACAQMVLSWFGVRNLRQSILYDEIHTFETNDPGIDWKSSPDGLENALNEHKPADYTGEFKIFARQDQIGIARRMAWTLFQFKVPCVALVKGGSHWIVVYSYEPLDIRPSDSSDTSYEITGFFIRNPVHKSQQGHIDHVTWLTDYANPVNNGGIWDGKFLCICDPAPGKGKRRKMKNIQGDLSDQSKARQKKFMVKEDPSSAEEKNPSDQTEIKSAKDEFPETEITMITDPVMQTRKIIDKNTAGKYAHWVLQKRRIHKSKALKLNLENPNSGDPILVEYIGKDDFYYIVPMKDFKDKIYATMIIEAKKVNYRESSFAMDIRVPLKLTPSTNKELLNLLFSKKYIKSQEPDDVQFHKALVWKSCLESLSPHLPFYMVTINNQKLFIRIDGEVFRELTQGVQGF